MNLMIERSSRYSDKEVFDSRILKLMKENVERHKDINPVDYVYSKIILDVLSNGLESDDRTGVGTIFDLGYTARFNIENTSPIITLKEVKLKAVHGELSAFVHGDTNIRDYIRRGSNIWNEWPYRHYRKLHGMQNDDTNAVEWRYGLKEFVSRIKEDDGFADEWGDLGPIYGKQWRRWYKGDGSELDQLNQALEKLISKPFSRQNIVSAWKADEIEQMEISGLPPCHFAFQLQGYVEKGELKLGTVVYMRSVDLFLGLPFNMVQYDGLARIIAKLTDMNPGKLAFSFGNYHVYKNHFTQVQTTLIRKPYPNNALQYISSDVKRLDDVEPEVFSVKGYDQTDHHGFVKAPIAV